MIGLFRLTCVFLLTTHCVIGKDDLKTNLSIFREGIKDLLRCYSSEDSTLCLEESTSQKVNQVAQSLKDDVFLSISNSKRIGKMLEEDSTQYNEEELKEIHKLEDENAVIVEKIKSRENSSSSLLDQLADLFSFGLAKIIGREIPSTQLEDQARGHKKKYLKKQNKHLKIILLMMLFKNKVKMFMQKIQVFIQLKFLGIAVLNLLINIVRLWLELKKKKPNKVVYYENAHHQHHYDHEHVHDEGHYSHPGSHSHYSHHEEDYGGGPWPWSRSYIDKQADQAFQAINRPINTQSSNLLYMKQRALR